MKRLDGRDLERFQELTRAALNDPDPGSFVKLLLEREKIAARVAEFSPAIEKDTAQRLYNNEKLVIERLEQEKSRLYGDIHLYSQSKKALRSYTSRFPIPPVKPLFTK